MSGRPDQKGKTPAIENGLPAKSAVFTTFGIHLNGGTFRRGFIGRI
jgi:hypothetical protein